MNRTCDDLLREWQLPGLIDRFKANGIDETSLQNLTEKLIKELIPEIGFRANFVAKWKDHVKDRSEKKGAREKSPTTENTNEQCSSDSSDDTDIVSHHDESDDSNQSNPTKLRRQKRFIGEEEFRKVQRRSVMNLLKNTIQGRLVLDAYKKTKTLSRKSRNILVDVLISEALVDLNGRLINEDFEFLANGIVKIFPTEINTTYYIPPVKKQCSKIGKSITARGKLVDKYRNKTRDWRRLTGSKLGDSFTKANGEPDESILDKNTDHSVTESVNWLGKNQAPWQLVMQHWQKTAKYRQDQISKITDKSVNGIIEIWPILKNPAGHVLIEEDFAFMKLTELTIGIDEWKIFFQKLRSSCPQSNRGGTANELIEVLHRDDLSDENKVATQIALLAFLVPPKGRVKAKKSHWKPTTIECQESMIIHAKVAGDVSRVQEERIEAMNRLGLTVQPYIIVVGQTLTDIQTFFVCVDRILYEVPSALKALDLCFKTFHVFDATYPAASEHLWYLLQIGLYEFHTKQDKQISYIIEIVSSIRAIH